MPIQEIDMSFFKKDKTSDPIEGTLPYFGDQIWIYKTFYSKERARFELLCQEFYRLIIPSQPQTIIGHDKKNHSHAILSAKISGFKPLPYHEAPLFANGTHHGLGQILVTSIFIHEIDLNLNNIGLDKNNRVVKIDGDWSAAGLIEPNLLQGITTTITPDLIEHLPFIDHYYCYNWLDIIQEKKNFGSSSMVDADLSKSPSFRKEINQTILALLLIPEFYIHAFVSHYLPNYLRHQTIEAFLSRQQELYSSAMNLDSFVNPKQTFDDFDIEAYTKHLQQFSAHLWFPVLEKNDHEKLKSAIKDRLYFINNEINRMDSSPTSISTLSTKANHVPHFFHHIKDDEAGNTKKGCISIKKKI